MKTILIVEDNEGIRENMAELLEIIGYRVVSAVDGQGGYRLIQQTKPDLIFCDLVMPKLDGYGLLAILQADTDLNKIPFYITSAKSEPVDRQKAMKLGATGYLTKPFVEDELLACLGQHFGA